MAQENHLWIGNNLTEVFYQDSTWYIGNNEGMTSIIVKDNQYFIDGSYPDQPKPIPFVELNLDLDTLMLYGSRTIHLFIKPKHLGTTPARIESIEYIILNEMDQVKKIYYADVYGNFRIMNRKNETILEKKLTTEEVNEILDLAGKMDIKGMNQAYGYRNHCDNHEYGIRITESDKTVHEFIAMRLRHQMLPIKNWMLNMGRN